MNEKPDVGVRIGSMLLDHFITTFLVGIVALPGFIIGMFYSISSAMEVSHDLGTKDLFGGSIYLIFAGFTLYFCKDSFQGRSIAKRILKLQVVEHITGLAASPVRCFVRNTLIILWPIEGIVTLVDPERRLGDRLAGTRLIRFNPEQERIKSNWKQIGFAFLLAYGFMVLLMLPLQLLMPSMPGERIAFVENSLNESRASELESLLVSSFEGEVWTDVLVYDEIEGEEGLKYVSVVLNMKYKDLDDDDYFQALNSKTKGIVLTKFPETTFVGRIKYLYSSQGTVSQRLISLDWREEQ